MTPNYVAKKSTAANISVLCILFFWLIVPLIIQIVRILSAKSYTIEFYDDKTVIKSGILNKQEKQSVFMGVYSVSVSQSLMGRIFGYGDIRVDSPGQWDIDTCAIADPRGLKNYLETRIVKGSNVNNIIHN